MDNLPRDDVWDAELDDFVPRGKTRWNGLAVEVTARLIPRYLWTTASIDVFLGGKCILRTGGQKKVTGSSSAVFHHDGSSHTAKLAWDAAIFNRFPFQLWLDDAKVVVSEVVVENFGLMFIPGALLASPVLLLVLWSILRDLFR